jgi:glycosyltransferase involved in cell wall biosynthesis
MLYHLCQVAKKIKDISFYVVGTARNDIPEFASKVPANLILIGKVSDDVLSSLLYQKADAVIVPSFKPGNSNRILEAMFYSKAILTTSVMCKYHLGLIRGVNVLAEDDFNKYPQLINALVYDNNLRRRLERNIASLHNRMYTWKFLSHVFQSQRYYSR